MSRDYGDYPIFSVSRHNLWPIRWAGYDRVGAGLFGFPTSTLGIPSSLTGLARAAWLVTVRRCRSRREP